LFGRSIKVTINSDGQKVLWVVDDEKTARVVAAVAKNLGQVNAVSVTHYVAGAQETANQSQRVKHRVAITDGSLTLRLTLPPKSVYGIVLGDAAPKP